MSEKMDSLKIESILDLIVKHRYDADYTKHNLSDAVATEPIPCSDVQVMKLLQDLKDNKGYVSFIISDIDFEEPSNIAGDELYPVTLYATKLPVNNRFYIEIERFDGDDLVRDEYIYDVI